MGVYMWSCEGVKVRGKDECRRKYGIEKERGKDVRVVWWGSLKPDFNA